MPTDMPQEQLDQFGRALDLFHDETGVRKAAASTAAFLLSYGPGSAIAQWEPNFYELMIIHGRALMAALDTEDGDLADLLEDEARRETGGL